MLGFVLHSANAQQELESALNNLAPLLEPTDHLVLIDTGSVDDSVRKMRRFAQTRAATVISLQVPRLSQAEALQIAADQTDQPYLMTLSATDRLWPKALPGLRQRLSDQSPDLVVLEAAWWLTSPNARLPWPDHTRVSDIIGKRAGLTSADLAALIPDPQRLIYARSALPDHVPDQHPWDGYIAAIERAKQSLFQPGPVLLRAPDPGDTVAIWQAIHDQIKSLPPADLPKGLYAMLMAGSAALTLAPPLDMPAVIPFARDIARAVPRRLRPVLHATPGPAGALFSALKGGEARALSTLILHSADHQHRVNHAISADYIQLQQQLEAALPGADYLRDLYDRVRGQ